MKTYRKVLENEIRDIQAQIDETDIVEGNADRLKENYLEPMKKCTLEQTPNGVTLEQENVIIPSEIASKEYKVGSGSKGKILGIIVRVFPSHVVIKLIERKDKKWHHWMEITVSCKLLWLIFGMLGGSGVIIPFIRILIKYLLK
jgi:hypothetical protein